MSSQDKLVTRWFFDPLKPNAHQEWQFKKGDEWFIEEDRDAPTMTTESLIEAWFKVLLLDTWEGKRAISTIAKHFDTTIRNVKTQRAYINSKNQTSKDSVYDTLLPELPDFTPHEQSRIDKARADRTPQDLFDAMPPELRKKAMAFMKKGKQSNLPFA
jgi:hypothetical protein